MNKSTLIRLGGATALVSILLFILSSVVTSKTGNPTGGSAMALYVASSLLGLVTMIALYAVHRSESAGMALLALLTAVIALFASFGSDPNKPEEPLFIAIGLLWAVSGLLFGLLALRSSKMPRGMGVLVLAMAAGALTGSVLSLMGNSKVGGDIGMYSNLLWAVWFVWLGIHFLTSKAFR